MEVAVLAFEYRDFCVLVGRGRRGGARLGADHQIDESALSKTLDLSAGACVSSPHTS